MCSSDLSCRDTGGDAGLEDGSTGANEPEVPWNITRVFAGDGSSAVSGERFRLGCFYAAASLTGGTEHYHQIDTMTVERRDVEQKISERN